MSLSYLLRGRKAQYSALPICTFTGGSRSQHSNETLCSSSIKPGSFQGSLKLQTFKISAMLTIWFRLIFRLRFLQEKFLFMFFYWQTLNIFVGNVFKLSFWCWKSDVQRKLEINMDMRGSLLNHSSVWAVQTTGAPPHTQLGWWCTHSLTHTTVSLAFLILWAPSQSSSAPQATRWERITAAN